MIGSTFQLYKNAYSGLTRRIWLLGVVMLVNRSGTMVLAFMTLYCKHLGYTIQQAGWVVAIYGIGSIAGGFIGGKISDRWGFYYTQFFALLLGGLMFILLGQMRSYLAICCCTFFLSMINESFRPANATSIAHYSTPENRTQSFAFVRLAINLGWGVGSALGGILASFNYHLLFWVDGTTNILAAICLLLILPKVSLAQQQHKPKGAEQQQKTSPYRDKQFMVFWAFTILFAGCFFQMFTTVPLFFKEGLHLSEFQIGVVMAANGIIIALFEMVLVFKLEGRRPYLVYMFIGSLLMALSYLVMNIPLVSGFLIASTAIVIMTLAEMIAMPFMNSYYIARSNETNRGQYAGMYMIAWSAAQVIGSSIGSLLAYRIGFTDLWWLVTGFCIIAAGGYYWLQQKVKVRYD